MGYIDVSGNPVIPPRFERASQFSEGLAAVETPSGIFGFIDRTGTLTISLEDDQVERLHPFSGGLAWVELQSTSRAFKPSGEPVSMAELDIWERGYYINRRGKVVWENQDGQR